MIVPTVHIAGPVQLGLGGLRQDCRLCGAVLREEFRAFSPDAAELYDLLAWPEGAEVVVQGEATWVKDRGHSPVLDKIALECDA